MYFLFLFWQAFEFLQCTVSLRDDLRAVACSKEAETLQYTIEQSFSTAEIFASTYTNHQENPLDLTKDIIEKLNDAVKRCRSNRNFVCNLKIPEEVSLVKIQLAELVDGTFDITGIFMRRKNNSSKPSSDRKLKLVFRIKTRRLSKRFVVQKQ